MAEDRRRRQPDFNDDSLAQRTEVFPRQQRDELSRVDRDDERDSDHDYFERHDHYAPSYTQYTIIRVARLIYFVFGIIEGLIAIRFILRLLGANSASAFGSFIYNVTAPLIAPFSGLFSDPSLGSNSVLELSSLVAIIVYALAGYALVRLLYVFAD